MIKPLHLVLSLSALALSSLLIPEFAIAAAPTPAPTPVTSTRPDFSAWQFLTGTWTCHQMVRGKNRPDTSTTTIGLDGAYMISHDTAPPFDKYRKFTLHTDSYTTYNPQKKQWVTATMDSTGGYTIVTSPGWQGITLKSTVTMTNDGTTGSDVLTKNSDTKTTDVYKSTSPNGKTQTGTITCTKG